MLGTSLRSPRWPRGPRKVPRAERHLRQRQELAGGSRVQGADAVHHLQAGGRRDVQEAVAQGHLQALQQHLGRLGQVLLGQGQPPLWGWGKGVRPAPPEGYVGRPGAGRRGGAG